MTNISLHMQWPLTSQSHGSVSQREQLVFSYGSNSTPKFSLYVFFAQPFRLLFPMGGYRQFKYTEYVAFCFTYARSLAPVCMYVQIGVTLRTYMQYRS
jgi:hypothetical protein